MTEHLFLTTDNVYSARWCEAFPEARIVTEQRVAATVPCQMVWLLIDGSDWAEQIGHWSACAPVVALTLRENAREARKALLNGAAGYVHALAAPTLLRQVHEVISQGGVWMGAELMRQLVTASAAPGPERQTPALEQLTPRERAVAQAVADGHTNREVAKELSITERTVKAHLGSVYEKLHIRDRVQLALLLSGGRPWADKRLVAGDQ